MFIKDTYLNGSVASGYREFIVPAVPNFKTHKTFKLNGLVMSEYTMNLMCPEVLNILKQIYEGILIIWSSIFRIW
jgi:hypothetical protein